MAMEGIRLDDGGSRRSWPLMVPRALLEAYQPLLGPTATLLWLNLYSMTDSPAGSLDTGAGSAGARGSGARLPEALAPRMGISAAEVERAWTVLEGAGLVRQAQDGWVLSWPGAPGGSGPAAAAPSPAASAPAVPVPAAAGGTAAAAVSESLDPAAGAAAPAAAAAAGGATLAAGAGSAAASVTSPGSGTAAPAAPPAQGGASGEGSLDESLGAVVAFYHQRIGLLGPAQFQRLRFWVEEQGMSPEVVAAAIEETVQSARTPRMNYLEGILRNWYNEGIRRLDDLQRTQRSKALRQAAPVEGAPNAGAYRPVDADAVRRWKEMFADEYDG